MIGRVGLITVTQEQYSVSKQNILTGRKQTNFCPITKYNKVEFPIKVFLYYDAVCDVSYVNFIIVNENNTN